MPILNFFVSLILLCSVTISACAEGIWVYASTTTGRPTIEISQESARVAIGDKGYEATFCVGVELHCFRSIPLSFAVPANLVEQREWKEGDLRYTVIGKRRIRHAGQKIRVLAIRARESQNTPVFLYSPEVGLVGIAENNRVGSKILYVEGHCGFPLSACTPQR